MRTRATRRLAALMTIAALALAGIAVPVSAQPDQDKGKTEHAEHSRHGRDHKPDRAKRFAAVGFVEAVDSDLVVVHVKGGLRGEKGNSVEFTVDPDARVKVDGHRAELSAVEVGMRVLVKGVRERSEDSVTYTAHRVRAHTPHSPDEAEEEDS